MIVVQDFEGGAVEDRNDLAGEVSEGEGGHTQETREEWKSGSNGKPPQHAVTYWAFTPVSPRR